MHLERPIVAVDAALFSLQHERLVVLLSPRSGEPFRGALALPGVAVRADETLLQAAQRALHDKGGLPRAFSGVAHMEQLATFDGLYRDPRGRTISVAHMGLTAEPPQPSTRSAAVWRPVASLSSGSLPFDHDAIVQGALLRLRGKLRYTNIAARLLPATFCIDELQQAYEAILGRSLNRANFRTKLLRIGLIEQAGVRSDAVGTKGGRPPHVYRFTSADVAAEERDFL